jgi:hypothetical protein
MADTLILLAPLIMLVIVVLFGFIGCTGEPFTSRDTPPEEPPETPPSEPYSTHVEATDGFLALWPLNETSGIVAAATSAAALNIDGEYKPGATPGSEGAFFHKEPNTNFAPELNGTTGYVEVPFNAALNPEMDLRFSVELWAKAGGDIPAGEEQILVSSHHISTGGNHRGYEILLIGAGAGHATVRASVFNINTGLTNVDVTPGAGDPLAWRHIVLTYDGPVTTMRLYVNVTKTNFDTTAHEESAEYSPVQAGGAGERPLRFGAGHLQAGEPEEFFAGRIDEVAFYQAVMPAVTVEAHFNLF